MGVWSAFARTVSLLAISAGFRGFIGRDGRSFRCEEALPLLVTARSATRGHCGARFLVSATKTGSLELGLHWRHHARNLCVCLPIPFLYGKLFLDTYNSVIAAVRGLS